MLHNVEIGYDDHVFQLSDGNIIIPNIDFRCKITRSYGIIALEYGFKGFERHHPGPIIVDSTAMRVVQPVVDPLRLGFGIQAAIGVHRAIGASINGLVHTQIRKVPNHFGARYQQGNRTQSTHAEQGGVQIGYIVRSVGTVSILQGLIHDAFFVVAFEKAHKPFAGKVMGRVSHTRNVAVSGLAHEQFAIGVIVASPKHNALAFVQTIVGPGLLFLCVAQMFKNHITVGVDTPSIIRIMLQNVHPVLLIAIGACFVAGAAILGKSFGQIPTESVDMKSFDPMFNNPFGVVLGVGRAMVQIVVNAIGMSGLLVEIGIIACRRAPSVAVGIGHPHAFHRITAGGMIQGNIQNDGNAMLMKHIHQFL